MLKPSCHSFVLNSTCSPEEFHRPDDRNQFRHVFRTTGVDSNFLGGKKIDIDELTDPLRIPPTRAVTVTQHAPASNRKRKRKRRAKKKERRRTRRKADKKKSQPKGTSGVNPTRATQISRNISRTYAKRALTVGGFQRNVILRLMRQEGNFVQETDEFTQAYDRAKPLAVEITKRQRSCIETRDLLLYDTYAAIMLAIDDINDPTDLKAQSLLKLQQGPSTLASSSSSSSSTRRRFDLPEIYPDSIMEELVERQTIYYALPAFFFHGKAAPNSEDNRIRKAAEQAGSAAPRTTRSSKEPEQRTTDDKAFFARWIYERYQAKTGFVPYSDRGIQVFNTNAT